MTTPSAGPVVGPALFTERRAGMDSNRVVRVLHSRACAHSGLRVKPISAYPGGPDHALVDAARTGSDTRLCRFCMAGSS